MANDRGFDNKPKTLTDIVGGNIASDISGILFARPSAKYTSGARTTLKVNGKLCGFCFDISWKITTDVTEVLTIDSYMPYELAPRRVSVEGTMSALHIPGQGPSNELWQSDALSFLFDQYITIEVRDSKTDQLLFMTAKAMITSSVEELKVDQIGQVTLTWKAIGWRQEATPERPRTDDRVI